MEKNVKELISKIKKTIVAEIKDNDAETIGIVYKAYNRYQEDERDGVDYIFDINNQADLLTCVKGGMTAQQIAAYWIEYNNDGHITNHFFFGANHGGAYSPIRNYQEFHDYLRAWLEDVLYAVLTYPWVDEYKTIYQRYLTLCIEKK